MSKIFLAHAKEDKEAVIDLYYRLRDKGYNPWLDEQDLLPGQIWRAEIPKAIKDSQIFVACLSNLSIGKQGYVQEEFKMALKTYASKPAGSIYLIPLRLDDCPIPELRQEEYGIDLRDIQWLDFFAADGFDRLIKSLEYAKEVRPVENKSSVPIDNSFVSVPSSILPSLELKEPSDNQQAAQKKDLKKNSDATKLVLVEDKHDTLEGKQNSSPPLEANMSATFRREVEDSGLSLLSPDHSKTHIESLFVYPELQIMGDPSKKGLPIMNGSGLLSSIDEKKRWIIFGDHQSGKTSFSKKLFLDALSSGYTPLLVKGTDIKSSGLEKIVSKAAGKIYPGIEVSDLLAREDLVCIIDDLSQALINTRAQKQFIENINTVFPRSIILAGEPFQFAAPDFSSLDEYEKGRIIPFGHFCRNQLIYKWVDLELGERVPDDEIWKRKDELSIHVEALVRKNVVPSKPVYILMIIQSFKLVKARNYELTSYGHCYQYLIYQALDKAHIRKTEFDQYLNFLSELGRAVLDSASECLDKKELDLFFARYLERFITADKGRMIESLIDADILEYRDNHLSFKYRYLFYFFASKNLADTLHRGEEAKETISKLIDTVHLDRSSNIVLFLSHHSKDPWILNEILYSTMDIFPEEEEATLEPESLRFLKEFSKDIPDLTIGNRDARKEREKKDIRRDKVEREKGNVWEDDELNEDIEISDLEDDASVFIRKVEKVFRMTEVCGQILRNRIGSLERGSLELLYEESIASLLKLLNILLKTSERLQKEGLRLIESLLIEFPDSTEEEIAKKAQVLYMEINYLLMFSSLQKISFSLGSDTGKEIYESVTAEKGTAAVSLVRKVMELQFEKKIDHKGIDNLRKQFISSKNPICDRLLKMIVVYHCYMHDVSYKDRQMIASTFGMDPQALKVMEARKQQRKINMA